MHYQLLNYPNHQLLYEWLVIILLVACVTDVIYRRIPNIITYTTIIFALLIYYLNDGLGGFFFSLSGAAVGCVFLVPYAMGGMGAGDVKLMCAVGAVLGPAYTGIALLFIALAGGVLAIGLMLRRRIFKKTMSSMFLPFLVPGYMREQPKAKADKKDSIPYAVAIAAGFFLFSLYMMMDQKKLFIFDL